MTGLDASRSRRLGRPAARAPGAPAARPAAVIHLRSAISLLGRFPALAGVDLEVDRGEIVLIQGPNGAGKTTLLRACAGLLPFASGEAVVLGTDLLIDRTSVRRRVGLLGHATGLYDELTVGENMAFWSRAAGADQTDVDAAMLQLGLNGRLRDVAVSQLSAGQRRRTSLAVLVSRRPELWLLDEPHAGLDQSGRDLVDALVSEAASKGATVLIASHERERAASIAKRTVVIAGGSVQSDSRSRLEHTAPVAEAPRDFDRAARHDEGEVVAHVP